MLVVFIIWEYQNWYEALWVGSGIRSCVEIQFTLKISWSKKLWLKWYIYVS